MRSGPDWKANGPMSELQQFGIPRLLGAVLHAVLLLLCCGCSGCGAVVLWLVWLQCGGCGVI